jgi:hypothetical protein
MEEEIKLKTNMPHIRNLNEKRLFFSFTISVLGSLVIGKLTSQIWRRILVVSAD